jgi:hypothetical protein
MQVRLISVDTGWQVPATAIVFSVNKKIGPDGAYNLVVAAPVVVARNLTEEAAIAFKARLEERHCVVEIEDDAV